MRLSWILLGLLVVSPVCAELTWDTSEIKVKAGLDDEQTTAVYRFTNTGDAPVTISNVRTTCGCTTAGLEKRTYAPGESGEIKAVFDHGERVGQQHKTITVTTDEQVPPPPGSAVTFPEPRTYDLQLNVNIPDIVRVKPILLRWRKDDTPQAKTLRVEIDPEYQVKVTGVEIRQNTATQEVAPDNFDVGQPVEVGPGIYEITVTPRNMTVAMTVTGVITTDFPSTGPRVARFFLRIY